MTQDEYDDAVTVGFVLGTRLIETLHGLEQSPSSENKMWNLLKEVAEGRVTLSTTPVELQLKLPAVDPHKLEKHHRRCIGPNQKHAQAILRSYAKRPGE